MRSVEPCGRATTRPRRGHRLSRVAVVALLASCLAVALAPAAAQPGGGRPAMNLPSVLGGVVDDGFERARLPRAFRFPEDHGPHPAFRSEWWYLTATVEDGSGRPYGVQFTLFRQALAPPVPVAQDALPAAGGDRRSAWRTRAVWMAHVALTAPETGHQAAERFARDALGMAGVRTAPFSAWLDDWTLSGGEAALMPLRLRARVDDVAVPFELDLTFTATRPPVPQGDDGLSRKSATVGNASHYYSFTRLDAAGRIDIGSERLEVLGLGWLDREWSTSVLDADQSGWDWFALHLDDGHDLMIYRIRRADVAGGGIDAHSAGILVDPQGTRRRLDPEDWRLEPTATWGDEDGARWPVRWRLEVPSAGIAGSIEAVLDDQLNRLSVRYWEGMVRLDGSRPGRGFLELTGYESGGGASSAGADNDSP